MIYHGTNRFVWPSLQYASSLLAVRIAKAQAKTTVRDLARAA